MSVIFDITTSESAYSFLLDALGLESDKFIIEYVVECCKDIDLFWERNRGRLDNLKLQDVHFVAFHVTGSLDECAAIKEYGIRNLQYVLSNDTVLSRLLRESGIYFDVEKCIMYINESAFDINYEHYRTKGYLDDEEEQLESIAHRIYYDYCVDGFWVNDSIERYGTDIHKRPEFISTLINLCPEAARLDTLWKNKSKSYKVFFYATLEQIHKFTFDLDNNYASYTDEEENLLKKWMLRMAVEQAFEPGGEYYIYIRDYEYIPPEQIICCEIM